MTQQFSGQTRHDSQRRLTLVLYALYALALIVGLSALVAIVVNYLKRSEVAGTHMESHFIWQMRTFWWSLLWFVVISVVGGLAVAVGDVLSAGLMWLPMSVLTVWYAYRVVRGALRAWDGRPMYAL